MADRRLLAGLAATLLLAVGCEAPADPALAPCLDGTWGPATDPAQTVLVHATPSEATEAAAAFDDLADAVAFASEPANPSTVLIGAGEWAASILLSADGAPSADGLTLMGCSSDETTLEPAPGLLIEPLLDLVGVQDLTLSGLRLLGGRNALTIRQGADVAVTDLVVQGSSQTGIFVSGQETLVALQNVDIANSTPTATGYGWGLAVADVGTAPGATGGVTLDGGSIEGNLEMGVYVSAGRLEMSGTAVSGTMPSTSGRFGRGIHTQDFSHLSLDAVELENNSDAAVFAHRPASLEANGVIIILVPAAELPDGTGATTGDGIVATRAAALYGNTNPGLYDVAIEGTQLQDVDRAGVLLEGVTASLSGNEAVDGVAGVEGTAPGTFLYGTDGALVTLGGGDAAVYEEISVDAAPLDIEEFSLAAP